MSERRVVAALLVAGVRDTEEGAGRRGQEALLRHLLHTLKYHRELGGGRSQGAWPPQWRPETDLEAGDGGRAEVKGARDVLAKLVGWLEEGQAP